MKKIAYTILMTLTVCFAASAQQNLRSAYFLDGYTYGYKMNPSIAPERGFFAFPAIGNLGVGLESNMALSTFLYPTAEGNLTTFMNSSVADSDFLGKLKNSNRLNFNLNESILAFGFRTGYAFHTVDLSVKADVGAVLPKDLFAFVKTGGSAGATAWDISRTGIRANSRLELAYGYSRPINDWIRVGGRAKVLMGIARADVLIDNLNLQMSGTEWSVTSHGQAEISGPLTVGTLEGTNEVDFDSIEFGDVMEYISTPSIGLAFDLGASFDFLDYFTASVSVLDLGYISWNETTTAVMPGGKWNFNGFGTIETGEGSSIGDQFSQIGDEFMKMLKLEKSGDALKKSDMLSATLHAGFEARMPFYERLAFGLLYTQRFDGIYSWSEGRLSANVAPTGWFSAAASYAYSSYGNSLGGVVNIHLAGLNLYAGVDSFLPLMNVTPQYIPVDSMNTNLTLGLTFLFGKPVGRYRY